MYQASPVKYIVNPTSQFGGPDTVTCTQLMDPSKSTRASTSCGCTKNPSPGSLGVDAVRLGVQGVGTHEVDAQSAVGEYGVPPDRVAVGSRLAREANRQRRSRCHALYAIRLPAPGTEPPIRFSLEDSMEMPWPVFPRSRAPFTSVPM